LAPDEQCNRRMFAPVEYHDDDDRRKTEEVNSSQQEDNCACLKYDDDAVGVCRKYDDDAEPIGIFIMLFVLLAPPSC